MTSTATIRRVGGTRGEYESGRDHVILASVVLVVLGFSNLLDGVYGSRPDLAARRPA